MYPYMLFEMFYHYIFNFISFIKFELFSECVLICISHSSSVYILSFTLCYVNTQSAEKTHNLSFSLSLFSQSVTVYLDLPPTISDTSLTAERQLLTCNVTRRLLRWAGYEVTSSGDDGDGPAAGGDALVCVTGNPRLRLPGEPAPPGESGAGDAESRAEAGERSEGRRREVRMVVEPVVSAETGRKEVDVTAAELRRWAAAPEHTLRGSC